MNQYAWMDGWMDGWMDDRQTDGRTDRQMDEQMGWMDVEYIERQMGKQEGRIRGVKE